MKIVYITTTLKIATDFIQKPNKLNVVIFLHYKLFNWKIKIEYILLYILY